MKIKHLALLIPLLVLVGTAPVIMQGCAGTPNRIAYQTLGTERLTVQEAMGFFNVWVRDQTAKHVDTKPTELKVKALYEKWQAAQINVLNIGKLNAVAVTTNAAGDTGLSAVLEEAITNAAQYKADLFAFLSQIGVKFSL